MAGIDYSQFINNLKSKYAEIVKDKKIALSEFEKLEKADQDKLSELLAGGEAAQLGDIVVVTNEYKSEDGATLELFAGRGEEGEINLTDSAKKKYKNADHGWLENGEMILLDKNGRTLVNTDGAVVKLRLKESDNKLRLPLAIGAVRTEVRQFMIDLLKRMYTEKKDEFTNYLFSSRPNFFKELGMTLHDLGSMTADKLTELGIVVDRGDTRWEIREKLLNKTAELSILEDNLEDEEYFNEKFREYFGSDFNYEAAYDFLNHCKDFNEAKIQDKLIVAEKTDDKFSKTLNNLIKTNLKSADDYMSNSENIGGLMELATTVALMYVSGGSSAIAKYSQMAAKGANELTEVVITSTAGKKAAQSVVGQTLSQAAGITAAQTNGAAMNAVAFQMPKVAELVGETVATGHVDKNKVNVIAESAEGLFKFGYVGSAISGPLGMQIKGLTTKLLNSKPIINQILTKGITNKPTALTSVLKDISEHSEAIGEVLKFGTEFGINADYMAYDDGTSYTDAMKNLAQMDGVSKMVIAMLGGKNLEFLTPKKVQQIKTDLAGYKVNISIYEGQKVYSVKDAKGKETVLATPEELFMFILDKEAQNVGVKAETAKTDNTPQPNPSWLSTINESTASAKQNASALPQGAREQGGVRAKNSSKLVGDNVSVASAVEFSKFKTNRRIKGFDKNLNPSQLTEAELQAKKQVEEYLKNNFPDLATRDNIIILKEAWLMSPEFTQKALNNPRKFEVLEVFSLVEAYKLEPNLTEKYLNIKSENGAYRLYPGDLKNVVKAHLTDAVKTEELLNTKLENGQYKYDGTEVLSLVEAYQMNTKATDMFLSLKNEKGEPRFKASFISSLVEAYNKNPELVEDLLTQEYCKGMIRHEAQSIVDAVKAYEIDPIRFKEILDEKGQPPYDYAYIYDGSDALKIIEAEQIDSKVAKMLEAQYREGGLPRFFPAMIRSLTEVYNEHPQTIDRISNIKNINGVYKFLSGESMPDKDFFNSILEKCEKYPEILEIAENNETIFGFKSLRTLCNNYEKNPEFVKNSLNLKNTNGSPRFDISQVDYLTEANETNPNLTKEALEAKTADGKEYRFNAYEVRELTEADKINHEQTRDLLTQKKSDGSYYSGSEIREIVSAREASPDIYDSAIKNGFSDVDAAKIVAAFKQSKDPDLVKLLMGYKNSEGKSKFDGQTIIGIVLTINNAPHNKAKILDYLNNDISMNTIYDLLGMEKILSKDEFDKLKDSFNTVVDYCKAHNIKYDNLSIDKNKKFKVSLEENGYSCLVFDTDGKMIKETILDLTNPNFNKERLVNKDGDKSILARVESEPLGYEDFTFYTDNIQTVKDANGNFLYKEFCLKSKDVEGKFDVWREEANGKKYKIGLAEKTPAGEIVLEKTLVANDGTKTDYNYMQSPDGSRLVYTKIIEPDGKVTENRQQFKVIDSNHVVSIENGKKYEIEYQADKIIVTKDNGEKVELSIGSNEIDSEGIISKDLLPIIKMLPGSALCDIKEFGLKKLWLNTNKAQEGNAMFVPSAGTIEVSKENSVPKNVFVLLHELGHYRDYFKFRENKELNDIFKAELEAFKNSATMVEAAAISYLIDTQRQGSTLKSGGMPTEFIAETNAIMHSSNYAPFIEMRGQYLQKYFPKTFAKVVELLKETGVQEYKPEE